jgi:dUTP pyrophosphatase
MKVKFKKLHEDAKAPYQGTIGSAGFDLTAVSMEELDNGYLRYGTGLAVEIPAGHVGLVFPRSSIFKTGMTLTNCVGVIDSDYRGEITAVFTVGDDIETEYKIGDRICQLIIMPYPQIEYIEASELSDTARGTGGYGSTGK